MGRRSSSFTGIPTTPAVYHVGGIIVLCAIAACTIDEPTAARLDPRVSLAKAPPAITVTSTDPTYGFQGDSVLTVRVKGTGFASGAHASWQINGDTTHVHEISTSFVSSTEVVATIKVDLDAPPALYDVVVTLIGGKKGVGAEIFTVKPVNERQQEPIPVAVTVEDAGVLGPYKIQSDGLGEYVNGQQGMQAVIDQFGNLNISPNNGQATTPAQRSLVFDFSAPADPLNTYRPNVSGQTNFKILSISFGSPARIQDLGVNGNPNSGCYRVTFAFRNLTTHHQLEFNPSINASATSAFISRTSASTWTVTSNGPCGANPNWGAVRSQDLVKKNQPLVFRGNYSVPFSILIRAL